VLHRRKALITGNPGHYLFLKHMAIEFSLPARFLSGWGYNPQEV
jgi:hypothetical protein